jgi:hypothetical protein
VAAGVAGAEDKETIMSIKLPDWMRPAAWGVAAGALGWWLILASGFGWVSASGATKMATQQAQDAVVAYATPACVARFERQPNAAAAWQGLQKADSWNRNDLVVKDGWVGEPSQKLDSDIANAIADSCATQILALKTLNGVKLSSE